MAAKAPTAADKSARRLALYVQKAQGAQYVPSKSSQGRLLQLARSGRYDVQIAPGVVYEAGSPSGPKIAWANVAFAVANGG